MRFTINSQQFLSVLGTPGTRIRNVPTRDMHHIISEREERGTHGIGLVQVDSEVDQEQERNGWCFERWMVFGGIRPTCRPRPLGFSCRPFSLEI